MTQARMNMAGLPGVDGCGSKVWGQGLGWAAVIGQRPEERVHAGQVRTADQVDDAHVNEAEFTHPRRHAALRRVMYQ